MGAYLIPQAMAYGSLAGVSPATSLTIAAIPLIVYMLLGRNPYMSLGPESTVALMAAAAVAPVATAYNVPWTTALAVTTVLVGIVLGIGWLIKASFLADLLSNPLLTGYLTGVAILMIISQLPKILGYDLDTGSIAGLVRSQWHVPNWQTVTIAATVVIVAFACRAISKRIPGPLIGLVVATIMGQFMDVPEVGPVSLELPVLDLTGLSVQVIAALLVPALSIAVVSFTDVMITLTSVRRRGHARRLLGDARAGGGPVRHRRRRRLPDVCLLLTYGAGLCIRFNDPLLHGVRGRRGRRGAAAAPRRDRSGSGGRAGRGDRLRRPDLAAAP